MAGHNRYTALLDANVLYSVAISDALMEVAATGIYAAKWSKAIDDEWVRNLAKNKNRAEADFHARRDLMHDACPDWEVLEEAWKLIEPCLSLSDINDRHVLAAAIAGHADSIVTINIKDFPSSILHPLGITALHPDEFLLQQLQLEPLVVLPAFKAMRARLKNPAFTPEKFVDAMERNGLIQTASFLEQALQLI
ncbi:PIN domain-containing protein [Jezberella montanilacus]|jgi:predicted nucleic acid-binding protein|uniref:PIN domain-containing protein n=1 Tax=Jezberella montanilacus TaxID=323426 RepID=A0A2T0XIH6_9BURK|nr:PIN domain-containing protein [Jezberella montanilacus]PRY98721.1 PIN domain-containing protein [Jezberella montanilacus]